MSVWKSNPDLMARLTTAQNDEININIDIMTFAGMCDTREELMAHVVRYELRAAVESSRPETKKRRAR
jgi:hypothetical protein